MRNRNTIVLLALLLLIPAGLTAQPIPSKTLIVGTKVAPPFAIKNDDGSWSGITISLWESVAKELNIDYELREYDLAGLLDAVEKRDIDVAAAALTVTAERETAFDFSHTFYADGLGIAVPSRGGNSWLRVVRMFFSLQFLRVIFALGLILFLFGILEWFFERKRNASQFGGSSVKGIGQGFWWSAVTMTTVGYGDKAPVTLGGRLIALIWMFTAIIIISSFTAAITSTLTVSQLESGISGPEDLATASVGTLATSTSEKYFKLRAIPYRTFADVRAGLTAVSNGDIDAFVYDAPILEYLINADFRGKLQVLPKTFEIQQYGLAFPAQSRLREPVNRALLGVIDSEAWKKVLQLYLGKQ